MLPKLYGGTESTGTDSIETLPLVTLGEGKSYRSTPFGLTSASEGQGEDSSLSTCHESGREGV